MKNQFITFLLIVCCLTLRIDVEAQGTWIMQDIPQAVSGVSLTKVCSDCIVIPKPVRNMCIFSMFMPKPGQVVTWAAGRI